jgi:3-oxoacyl-[acyl-carrier protein] reductase
MVRGTLAPYLERSECPFPRDLAMGLLERKIAVVTGASRGIGSAAAKALAEAGASVMLAARDSTKVESVARAISEAGGNAVAMTCDVADYRSMERLVEAANSRLGPINVLINNAGVIEPISAIVDSDPVEWALNVQINLVGAYHAVRALLPGMLSAGSGTIVNISSGAACRPIEGWSAYCATKAGLAMLTRAIALEAGKSSVRVFGFVPGTVDTDMQGTIRASGINPVSRIPRSVLTPVGHPAKAIVYLCTPEASDLTGQEVSLGDPLFRRRVGLP